MNLTLDHNQRLNLVAALDRIEAPRYEAHCICELQAKFDLNDDERKMIGYQKVRDDKGREFVVWSNINGPEPKTYEFDDKDSERIIKAMDKYPVILARDKSWWVALDAQLPPAKAEENGDGSSSARLQSR